MKNLIAALLLLVVASPAQRPTAIPTFAWNWRDAQEASETVGTSKGISETERRMLLNALAARFRGDPNPKKEAAETRVKLVDLNGDGVAEVIAQPVDDKRCSPTGNCPFWTFQKTAAGYVLLLDKGSIQTFTVQPTRTNGFLDLVLGMHGSATEQELFVYRFHDGRYRRTACYDATWTYLGKDGEYHDLKEPQIAPCPRASARTNNTEQIRLRFGLKFVISEPPFTPRRDRLGERVSTNTQKPLSNSRPPHYLSFSL